MATSRSTCHLRTGIPQLLPPNSVVTNFLSPRQNRRAAKLRGLDKSGNLLIADDVGNTVCGLGGG